MSDPGRKSFTETARQSVVPNQAKPLSEKIKESVTDAADRVAAVFQPKETKSIPQTVADKVRGTHDEAKTHVDDPRHGV